MVRREVREIAAQHVEHLSATGTKTDRDRGSARFITRMNSWHFLMYASSSPLISLPSCQIFDAVRGRRARWPSAGAPFRCRHRRCNIQPDRPLAAAPRKNSRRRAAGSTSAQNWQNSSMPTSLESIAAPS